MLAVEQRFTSSRQVVEAHSGGVGKQGWVGLMRIDPSLPGLLALPGARATVPYGPPLSGSLIRSDSSDDDPTPAGGRGPGDTACRSFAAPSWLGDEPGGIAITAVGSRGVGGPTSAATAARSGRAPRLYHFRTGRDTAGEWDRQWYEGKSGVLGMMLFQADQHGELVIGSVMSICCLPGLLAHFWSGGLTLLPWQVGLSPGTN